MSAIVIDLAFTIIAATIGIVAGWFLRSSIAPREPNRESDEVRHAREVLARLHELADNVSADVGAHTSKVEQINEELTSGDNEAEAVVNAVSKLLKANNQMQQQLTSADKKLKEQAHQIESSTAEARTDALTSLANRRAFDDEMAQRLAEFQRHGRAFSVIFLDVDHFKHCNDTHGHQAGDEVLRGLGKVLRRITRAMDVPARYGGEEFAVILPGTSVSDANLCADRIRKAIEDAVFNYGKTELRVNISLGVAESLESDDVASIVKRADAALYASKEAGRNCAHWHDGQTMHLIDSDVEKEKPESDDKDVKVELPKPQTKTPDFDQPANEPAAVPSKSDNEVDEEMSDWVSFGSLLNQRLAEWKRGGAPPAVLLARIDDYQQIVSKHGEHVGSMVLHATNQFLKAALRDMDLLSQHGNATFAVLVPGAHVHELIAIAERLRETISNCSLPLENGRIHFTISISGAEATGNEDALKLLHRAVEALEAALKSGGNCSYFHNGQWAETAGAVLEKV